MGSGGLSRILQNAVSNYARQLIQIITFLLLTPFIISKVGTEEFGLWSLIQATIGLLGLLDLGFANAVVKYIAEARGQGNQERVKEFTATFFWLYLLLGVVVGLLTVALVPLLGPVFGVPEEHLKTAQTVFVLIGLRSALGMPLGLFAGILVGYQRQLASNFCRTLGTVSYAVLAWWGLEYSPTLEMLAWVSLWTGIGANILAVFFCWWYAEGLELGVSRVKLGLFGEITSFSTYFFLIQISLMLATRVDTIVVNAFLPLSAVALYTVALRVAEKAGVMSRQFANSLTPLFAELKGAGEAEKIQRLLRGGTRISIILSLPLFLGLLILCEPLLVVWMGEEFFEATVPCQILVLASFVSLVHSNSENVLSMTGDQRFLAFSSIGTQVLNLALTLAMIPFLGLMGVALGTLLSLLIVQVLYLQKRIAKTQGIPLTQFYGEQLLPCIVPGAIYALSCWLLSLLFEPTGWMEILLAGSIPLLPYILGVYLWGLREEERSYVLKKIQRRRVRTQEVVS
ncbi:MAG: MATE family efflux transporter [Candidatus Sumerlaeia bacterium]|nr:MATE family efflux transporter [Candidatus Sumerlaeia bacterium]